MNIYKPYNVITLNEDLYRQTQEISFSGYYERNLRIMFIYYNKIILRPTHDNFVEMVRRFI